tara:strand:+ start:1392 stop:1952 length:561 start_codon:yes stop_codon:yes gene_type:complete
MIPNNFIEFYGDQSRWFLGSVVDVKDPMELGRVKVKVFGVYDDIDDDNLPWAQIVVPITQGIHEGKGQNLGILVGTQVFGMFLDGKSSQLPMVIGTVPKEGDTNSKATANYPLNKVYETETGHFKEYDDSGTGRIKEYHQKGTYYEMKEDGIHIYGDTKVTIHGKSEVQVNAPIVSVSGGVVKLNS